MRRSGLNVIPLPDEIRQELKKAGNPIWDWVTNPVDFSIAPVELIPSYITKMMVNNTNFNLKYHFHRPAAKPRGGIQRCAVNEFPWNDLKKKTAAGGPPRLGPERGPARTSPAVNYTAI